MNLRENEQNTYWKIARELDLEQKLREKDLSGFIIQGEICGPGIQKNYYELTKHKFFVFDVWDIQNQKYLHADERCTFVDILDLDHVPVIEDSSKIVCESDLEILDFILNYAEGKSMINKKREREGLVFKSRVDSNVSFKAISNKFLLKNQ
jgi:RNA ligase (TIGR02306 family)